MVGALKVKKTRKKKYKGHSGVWVQFNLAKEVYKNVKVDKDLLRKRIIDLSYNNSGLTFIFNGEKYLSKKGLFDKIFGILPSWGARPLPPSRYGAAVMSVCNACIYCTPVLIDKNTLLHCKYTL